MLILFCIAGGERGGRGERQQPGQTFCGGVGGRRRRRRRVEREQPAGRQKEDGGLDGEEAAAGALDGDGGDPGAVGPHRQRRPPTVSLFESACNHKSVGGGLIGRYQHISSFLETSMSFYSHNYILTLYVTYIFLYLISKIALN